MQDFVEKAKLMLQVGERWWQGQQRSERNTTQPAKERGGTTSPASPRDNNPDCRDAGQVIAGDFQTPTPSFGGWLTAKGPS